MRQFTLSFAAIVWLAVSTAQAQYDQEPRRFEPSLRAEYLNGPASNATGRVELEPADPPVPSGTMPAQYDAPTEAPRAAEAPTPYQRPSGYQAVVESPAAAESLLEASHQEAPPVQRSVSDRYATEPAVLESPVTASPATASPTTNAGSPGRPRAEIQTSLHTAPHVELATAAEPPAANRPSSDTSTASSSAPALLSPEDVPPYPLAESPAASLALPEQASENSMPQRSRGVPSIASVLGSLAVVLGLLMLVAWMFKRSMPKSTSSLPPGVVEVLGRAALAPRNYVHLVRVGNKLLLVSVTPAGAETLTEITDPLEVDRLAGMCMQGQPNSSSQAFRQMFQQFSQQPNETNFVAARRRDRRPLGGTNV